MVCRLFLTAALLLCFVRAPAHAAQAPVSIVFFVEWSGALDETAQGIIRHAADMALQTPGKTLTVTGYADRKGSRKADIYLSQLRAQLVADTLVADGVTESRIGIVANGALPVSGVIGRRVEITLGDAP